MHKFYGYKARKLFVDSDEELIDLSSPNKGKDYTLPINQWDCDLTLSFLSDQAKISVKDLEEFEGMDGLKLNTLLTYEQLMKSLFDHYEEP